MNPVPEDIVVGPLSREQQLELLFQKLAGNKSFRSLRGRFTENPGSLLSKTSSPSETLRYWDGLSKDIRVMLNLLAKFKRNGWTVAYSELLSALNSSHVIEGEIIPVEDTTPMTAVIFDAGIALSLADWALTHTLEDYKQFVLHRKDASRDPVLGNLHSALPTLEKIMAGWQESNFNQFWRGSTLLSGQAPLFEEWKNILKPKFDFYHRTFLRLDPCGQEYVLACRYAFGILLQNVRSKELLEMVPRSKQERLGMWHFDVPTMLLPQMTGGGDSSHFSFCLHPEEEHPRWSKMYPALISKNIQHGKGAVLLPRIQGWDEREILSRGYLFPERSKWPADNQIRLKFDLFDHFDDGIH